MFMYFSFLQTSKQESMPVTALDYNYDGSLMCYAIGYDWSRVRCFIK